MEKLYIALVDTPGFFADINTPCHKNFILSCGIVFDAGFSGSLQCWKA